MANIITKMEFNIEVDLHLGRNMEMEYPLFLMGQGLKGSGKKTIYKGRLKYIIKMETIFKVIYICLKKMGKVFTDGIIMIVKNHKNNNKNHKFNIKDNSKKIVQKDMQL